jgi:site-specific DNA-methyltransferase (adenine-specific)
MNLPINQIVCGDNVTVMSQWPDDCIDMTCTSPPYGQLRKYGGHSWDFEGVAQQLWRVTKPGGVVVWVVADETVDGSESGESFRQALRFKEIGFRLHDTMIYAKSAFAKPFPNRYHQAWEFMFILSNGEPATFNPLCDKRNNRAGAKTSSTVRETDGRLTLRGVKTIADFGRRLNWWLIDSARNDTRTDHPAPFPESLARDHILSWSNENDIVLDPFCGSATTPKMARAMGRRWIGIEVNPDYIEICKRRMSQQVLSF